MIEKYLDSDVNNEDSTITLMELLEDIRIYYTLLKYLL